MDLEQLRKIRVELSTDKKDVEEPTVPSLALEAVQVDLADYPWEQCIADQTERYGDEETAKKVCGAIKAMYARKEDFVIPAPESGEEQDKYISRCISAIYDEYGQEQAAAICYATWEKK
jgi:hypothetical protein